MFEQLLRDARMVTVYWRMDMPAEARAFLRLLEAARVSGDNETTWELQALLETLLLEEEQREEEQCTRTNWRK